MQKAEGADHAGARSALVSLRNLDTEREHFMRRYHDYRFFVGLAVYLSLAIVGGGTVAAACGGGGKSAATATPLLRASQTAVAAATRPTTKVGVAETPVTGTPAAFSTLTPLLQGVSKAVETGDAATLGNLLHPRAIPCSPPASTGLGAGPECPPGTAEGTAIGQFINAGDCEGGAVLPDTAVTMLAGISAEHPQLVGWVAGAHDAPNSPMALDYLVFSVPVPVPAFGSATSARAVGVDSTGIVSILMGCGSSPGSYARFLAYNGGTVHAVAPSQ